MTFEQFICPKCNGRHFGSAVETRDDGSVWKIAEECHDEFGVGCRCRIAVEPVILVEPKRKEIVSE